jgi:hypothetical protein
MKKDRESFLAKAVAKQRVREILTNEEGLCCGIRSGTGEVGVSNGYSRTIGFR